MALHRLYLDTNVLVEAFEEPSSAGGKVFALAAAGQFFVVESVFMLREVDQVFRRLYGRRVAAVELEQLGRFPAHEVVTYEESLASLTIVREHTRDAADAPHFAAAVDGGAEALVTRNRRSVHPGMFALMPIAMPEDILPALEGTAAWPAAHALMARWERWATKSPKAPRKDAHPGGTRPKD